MRCKLENCILVERLNTLNTDLESVLLNSNKFAVGQGIIQNLNLGNGINLSSHRSITNVKKYCKQIDLSCSVICLV